MIWFFVITSPILMFVLFSYEKWLFGELIVNLCIFLYLYLGTWLSIPPSKSKFEKYFGKDGLYIPEESIIYRWSLKLGNFHIKLLPKGKHG